MSEDLLMAVGGLVTDKNFREAVFGDFDATLNRFNVKDAKARSKLYNLVIHAKKNDIKELMIALEPFICGETLDDCERMRPVPEKELPADTSTDTKKT